MARSGNKRLGAGARPPVVPAHPGVKQGTFHVSGRNADGQHARIDGFTSLAVLIGVAGVLLGGPILDPIVGLLITIAILFILKDAGRAVFRRLLDGIEPDLLARIEHAPTHVDGVRGVEDVRARWLGHRVHAELSVLVDPGLSVADGDVIAGRVRAVLREHVPGYGEASVQIVPIALRG